MTVRQLHTQIAEYWGVPFDPGYLDMGSAEAGEEKGKEKGKETTILAETPVVNESEFRVLSSAENTYQGPTRGNHPWQ